VIASRARVRPVAAPWQVAGVLLFAYCAFLGAQIGSSGMRSTTGVGEQFVRQSTRSPAISRLHGTAGLGYDGEFAYFIALDPSRARYYVDPPPVHWYTRILYPIAARALAVGSPGAIPYTLVGLNVFAVVATVFLLGGYLRRHGLSAWWAAVYGLFPGVVWCVARDLTEPLGFFFAAWGFVLFDRRRDLTLLCAPLFAAAALARESTALFPVVVAAGLVVWAFRSARRRERTAELRRAALLLVGSLGPLVCYWSFLRWWLGSWDHEGPFPSFPFGGFFAWPFDSRRVVVLLGVVVPGLAWLALTAGAALRDRLTLPLALVIANVLLYVVFLPARAYVDYSGAGRSSAGVVLAALLALPALRVAVGTRSLAVRSAIALLTPAWFLLALLVASS
jgi:hypothetical protein